MFKYVFSKAIPFIITSCVIMTSQAFTGGTGTKSDPFQIGTLADLRYVSENSSTWTKNYVLTADIDAADTKSWNEGQGFSPIGNESSPYSSFDGIFDGNGHTISKLYINRRYQDSVGLFGFISGSVKNLKLEKVYIKGRNKVGGIAGYARSAENCSVSGTIVGGSRVGGLAGYVDTTDGSELIHRCSSSASVKGSSYSENIERGDIGGLVGYSAGNIYECYTSGKVEGEYRVGGIAGENRRAIQSCYSICTIEGEDIIGGIAGWNSNFIDYCFASGSLSGSSDIGGLVGHSHNGWHYSSYATASIQGNEKTGGLIGSCSNPNPHISNCYWDKETTDQVSSAGSSNSFGLSTKQFALEETFNNWTFLSEEAPNARWTISRNNDGILRPTLTWDDSYLLKLHSGYQLIAFDFDPIVKDITSLFRPCLASLESIESTYSSNKAVMHKVGNRWENQIGDWNSNYGYLVKMKEGASLRIGKEDIAEPRIISLKAGKNIIQGWAPTNPTTTLSFQSLGTNLNWIKNAKGQYLRKVNGHRADTINSIRYGEALIVDVKADCSFIMPADE